MECVGADGPERGDPDGSGEVVPLVGEVEVEKLFAGAALARMTVFKGEERGIADEEGGVGDLEHGLEVRGMLNELWLDLPEAGEEDFGVDRRRAGGAVERNAADAGDIVGYGAVGIADDQNDGPDAVLRSDNAGRDYGERRREGEGSNGNEADVGFAGSELDGAFGGRVGGEEVAWAKRERSGSWSKLHIKGAG